MFRIIFDIAAIDNTPCFFIRRCENIIISKWEHLLCIVYHKLWLAIGDSRTFRYKG